MPPKARIRKQVDPIYNIKKGTDRVIKNKTGTKIGRKTIVRLKRKNPVEPGPRKTRAKKTLKRNLILRTLMVGLKTMICQYRTLSPSN